MSFLSTKEKEVTSDLSHKAIDRIRNLDILPTPENYELWYVYFARSVPEVVRVLDGIIENGQPITDYVCSEVYARFLSDLRNEESIRNSGAQVQNTIESVSGAVLNVKEATKNYGEKLNEANSKISSAKSQSEIQAAVQMATDSTKVMMHQSAQLEKMLQESNAAMEEMRRDLEHVRREAMTDGLTGLANRKAFDSEFDRMFQEATKSKSSFTILMLDIDHFKAFNDNFGHQVGDQVLRLVARTLRDSLKGKDFAARYGGEEFSILLPDTDMQGAVIVGNTLRKAVASKDVINRSTGKVLGRITMSVGVAQFSNDKTPEDLIERADAALYTAKHNGRNQVSTAPLNK